MTDERIAKLPKWAQDKIAQLESDKTELQIANDRLRNLSGGEEFTRIIVDPWHHKMPLEDADTVRFFTGDEKVDYRYLDISLDRRSKNVKIMANSAIIAMPGASNVLEVGCVDF